MRTIDADAFDATMYEAWKNNEVTNEEWVHFREMIKDEPTIEPQRMRGKWKGFNGEKPDWQRTDGSPVFLICSECGATVVNNFAAKWNYCCVCGADMRETE